MHNARLSGAEAAYATKLPRLTALGVTVESRFWLTNGLAVTAPLAAIDQLAQWPDVTFIEPAESTPAPTVQAGRALINSDFLYTFSDANYSSWTIGLLDSGVLTQHVQFVRDNRVTASDCVNGTSNYCRTGTNLDPSDVPCSENPNGHGTSSAAILTANSQQGDTYRGVSRFAVWSYKIYPSGSCFLDVPSAVRGFEAATADRVAIILAEMQDDGGMNGQIATVANNAFESGVAVIATNGNFGPGNYTVRSPAVAHRAIGVGAVDYQSLQTTSDQSWGPSPDGRTKPEVQAPTNTQTASRLYTTALRYYGGTSGAAPYAAAATALLGHWQTGVGTWPGDYYARLINWGSNFSGPANDNIHGAGLIVLPSSLGTNYWPGRVYLSSTFPSADITYSVPAGALDLRAAIWWAEGYSGQGHNNLRLGILDPNGTEQAYSGSAGSVFQKAMVPGALSAGTWTVRISCISCGVGAYVYFDANAQ